MIEKYYEDYYRGKIKNKDIYEKENTNKYYFNKELKRKGLKPYISYFDDIVTNYNELDKILRKKYSSIVNRCNGKTTDKYGHYKNMYYLTIQEYVNFCKENLTTILTMWFIYLDNGKQTKDLLSIDRIDDDKGYSEDNMQFTTMGFNSWKSSLNPIKVNFRNKDYFFMSCEEASRYFELNRKTIGRILRDEIQLSYKVEKTQKNKVLLETNRKNLYDYYTAYIY